MCLQGSRPEYEEFENGEHDRGCQRTGNSSVGPHSGRDTRIQHEYRAIQRRGCSGAPATSANRPAPGQHSLRKPGYYQGTVTSIEDVGGITTVQFANGSGQLLCGTAVVFWFDPTTPYGQSMLALALTAKALGSTVYVQGNGTCSTAWPYNNAEQLVAVSVSS